MQNNLYNVISISIKNNKNVLNNFKNNKNKNISIISKIPSNNNHNKQIISIIIIIKNHILNSIWDQHSHQKIVENHKIKLNYKINKINYNLPKKSISLPSIDNNIPEVPNVMLINHSWDLQSLPNKIAINKANTIKNFANTQNYSLIKIVHPILTN